MVEKLRKIFVVFAIVAIAVMGMPVRPAKAVTVSPGDLVKASGPAVYYYASNGKRFVFPTEKTYRTWYPDFSTIKVITDAELASIQIGGNVVYRPGTRLAKITTDPKTYAVGPKGVLHWITSEAVAIEMYGAAWATMIDDIPDAFFTNYTYGSDIVTAQHPDSTLIKYAGSNDIYTLEDGEKRLIADEASFTANMFMNDYVVTIADTTTYPTAMAGLSVGEVRFTDVAQLWGSTIVPVTGDLTVSVASDTPATFEAPRGGVGIEVAKFNFAAGSSDVLLNGLTLTRAGLGNTADITRVYLYNGMNKLSSGRSLSTSTHTAVFTNLGVIVPANSTVTLTVKVDTSALASGGSHIMTIAGVGDVGADASVGAIFPVQANLFTISGTVNVGSVDIESNGLNYTRKVGETNVEVGNFTVYVDNTENAQVESITLYNSGRDILSNFTLYRGTTLMASGSQNGDYITFVFTSPYEIPKGDSTKFTVKGDIGGRNADTATLNIRYKTDVVVKGLTYGYPLGVDNTIGSGASSYIDEVGSPIVSNMTTAEAGQLTASFNGPVSSDVAKNTNDIVLMNFALTAQSPVDVEKTAINISGLNLIPSDIEELELVCNDVIVTNWSTVTIGDNTSTDYWTLPAGGVNCEVRLNITNTAAGDETILATLVDLASASWSFKDTNTGDALTDIVPTGDIAGNTMTVTSASLVVNVASSPSTGSVYVPRTADAEMVAFLLTAGDASDVKVNNITFNAYLDNLQDGFTAADMNELSGAKDVVGIVKLYDEAGLPIGSAESLTVNATDITVTFDNFELDIPAGTTIKVLVSADITSTAPQAAGDDDVAFAMKSITAEYGSNGASLIATISGDNSTPSVFQTVTTAGLLTASLHADTPTSALIPMNASSIATKIKFAATREDIVVEKLAINLNGKAGTGAGSTVVAGDSDVGDVLVTNTGDYVDADLDLAWTPGECIYTAAGAVVAIADTRITQCATYAAGSVVVALDTDIGDAVVVSATVHFVDADADGGYDVGEYRYSAATPVAIGYTRTDANGTVTNISEDEFASSTLTYTNSAGNTESVTAFFVAGIANFSGLDVLVPKDDSAIVDVNIKTNVDTSADNYDGANSFASAFNLATTGFRSVTAVSGQVVSTLTGSAAGNPMYVFNSYPTFVVKNVDGTLTQKPAFEIGTFDITANGDKDVTFALAGVNGLNVEIYANGADFASDVWITDGTDTLCTATLLDVTGGSNTLSCGFATKGLTVSQNSTKTLHVFMDTLTATLGDNSGEAVSIALEEGTNNLSWSIDADGGDWTDVSGTEITDILFKGNLVGGSYSVQ